MTTLPAMSNEAVRAHFGDEVYARGQQYLREGRIFEARRQGETLKGCCEGSGEQPYRVWIRFDRGAIAEAGCSCPAAGGGRCKHAAALVLAWRDRRGEFAELEDVDQALAKKGRAELEALVRQMLRTKPELELLLDTPLPGETREGPIRPEVYRRQADAVFRHAGSDWRAASRAAEELGSLLKLGDEFLEARDGAGAAAVYTALARSVLTHYESFPDEEGALASLVQACVRGMGASLTVANQDRAARDAALATLFEVYRYDLGLGGVALGDEVPSLVVASAMAAEKRAVAGWVRQELASAADWARQVHGGFLLGLEADVLDDEGYLAICRETGRRFDLVEMLLGLGRVNEAVAESERASAWELVSLADRFVHHQRAELAEAMVLRRLSSGDDPQLLEWLKRRRLSQGDHAAALELGRRLFLQRPSLPGYRELRALSQGLGRWDALRPELLEFLEKHGYASLRVELFLDEGEPARALEVVQADAASGARSLSATLKLRVAEAVEATQPTGARELFAAHAEALIEQRGRANYQSAAALLRRVRTLHERLGETAGWATWLAGLKEKHRGLRALQEELARVGL